MKKFVAFALILAVGTFAAIGCSKPAEKKTPAPEKKAGAPEQPGKTTPPAAPEGEKK